MFKSNHIITAIDRNSEDNYTFCMGEGKGEGVQLRDLKTDRLYMKLLCHCVHGMMKVLLHHLCRN